MKQLSKVFQWFSTKSIIANRMVIKSTSGHDRKCVKSLPVRQKLPKRLLDVAYSFVNHLNNPYNLFGTSGHETSGKIYFRFRQKLPKRLLDVANSIGNYFIYSNKLFRTSGDHRKWLNSLPVYTKSS